MTLNILVTGAAGLLGGEVCYRLHKAGHRVTALVHTNLAVRANDGTHVDVPTRKGDVSAAQFGWSDTVFDEVAQSHDVLVHCAANVRFGLADADYQAVNIDGVRHAIALAKAGNIALLHISTAYVCGTRDGMIAEHDPLPDTGFANGYERSKATGERLVRQSGLRWAIARPSIVVGDHDTGAIRQFDTTYTAFKLIAEGHVRHMPARRDATLDFVPLDHVAAGIAHLAQSMDRAAGGTYHLVSAQPLPVQDFAGAIGSYPQFHQPVLVDPDAFDPSALPALERRLYKRVAGLYASYFQRNPRFEDAAWRAFGGSPCPRTGPAYIRRLIDYCIREDFLPA